MNVKIDEDTCTGCTLCVDTCPDVFEMDDDKGIAVVKSATVPADAEESCQEASDSCPVTAIELS